MYSSHNDSDSVDYDFFDGEDGQIKKLHGDKNYKDSSQVVTKAVIETHPLSLMSLDLVNLKSSEFDTKPIEISSCPSKAMGLAKSASISIRPSSTFENSTKEIYNLERSLNDCLAYVDKTILGKTSSSYIFEDKEFSDNSLSDSTITTISSELTSVSPCSLMSDSILSFEESTDSFSSHNGEDCIESRTILNGEQSRDCSIPEPDTKPIVLENKETSYCDNSGGDSSEVSMCCMQSRSTQENEIWNDDFEGNSCNEEESNDVATIEKELGNISVSSCSSTSSIQKSVLYKGQNKMKIRRKESNLTFNREELLKIERDNLILLKKIMGHSKPRSVSLNHTYSNRKTTAAINRAKQQKKIEQDNYILYSKISAVGRMKKVF